MDILAVAILDQISYGVVLFLVATGLSLVLGLMGIANVAHGALFVTGAYAGLMVAKSTGNLIFGILASPSKTRAIKFTPPLRGRQCLPRDLK